MSVNIKPVKQIEFRGINTAGNPIQRPANTAENVTDIRIMPGNWLRLRGGRRARTNTRGTIQQILPFRSVGAWGSDTSLVQIKFPGPSPTAGVYWHALTRNPDDTLFLAPIGTEFITLLTPIDTTNDNAFCNTNPGAACNLSDRPIYYNGLGTIAAGVSYPAFMYLAPTGGGHLFGLHMIMTGNPAPSWAAGGGGFNKVLVGITFYVGLYDPNTFHFSNAIKIGSLGPQVGSGVITLTGLDSITAPSTGTYNLCFYATIDGGQVPYLILNNALTGPLTAALTTASVSLSIASGTTNGWVLDTTSEAPFDNYPPRPMRSVAYVSGRIFGALMKGGNGSTLDFNYTPATRDMAAVCWSKSATDAVNAAILGDPLQCWPLTNVAPTPTAEQPIALWPFQDGRMLLVLTASATMIMEEQADGVMEYTVISRVHGITNPTTLRDTPYGTVWVNQRNQIVMLPRGINVIYALDGYTAGSVIKIHSHDYQSSITASAVAADYILEPGQDIDRYQVWLADGTSIVHDFGLDNGQGYKFTNHNFSAAATMIDSLGRQIHLVADSGLYTHEVQYTDGTIPTTDQTYAAPGSGTVNSAEITGIYTRNWEDFGDSDLRKELPFLDIIGDGDPSTQLGASPITVDWYADFEQVTGGNKKTATLAKEAQTTTASTYRAKLAAGIRFWFKFVITIKGHSTDYGGVPTYPNYVNEGSFLHNFYGSIMRILWRIGTGSDRA